MAHISNAKNVKNDIFSMKIFRFVITNVNKVFQFSFGKNKRNFLLGYGIDETSAL